MSTIHRIPMSALAVETWHRTLSQSDGRDKLFRLFQYLCKLLRGLDSGHLAPKPDTAAARIAALETAIATSRQIGRLFKWASVYAKSRARLSAPPAPQGVSEVSAVVSDAAMFSYYVCDNITFLTKMRLIRGDVALAVRRAARFWLAALVAGLVGNLYKVLALHRCERKLVRDMAADARAKKCDEPSESAEVDARRAEYSCLLRSKRAALLACMKHSTDAVVASGLSFERKLHPSLTGACGVFSSLVGFWQIWPRYLPTE